MQTNFKSAYCLDRGAMPERELQVFTRRQKNSHYREGRKMSEQKYSTDEICETLDIGRSTLFRWQAGGLVVPKKCFNSELDNSIPKRRRRKTRYWTDSDIERLRAIKTFLGGRSQVGSRRYWRRVHSGEIERPRQRIAR